MILHTVKTSPLQTHALTDCLRYLNDDDSVLLIEDAVISTSIHLKEQAILNELATQGRLWVLQEDLTARGLSSCIAKVCNYQGFVALAIKHKSHLAW